MPENPALMIREYGRFSAYEKRGTEPRVITIALGANLGFAGRAPVDNIHAAIARLSERGVRAVKVSGFYANPAWPKGSGPDFVNAVAIVETTQTPEQLLQTLLVVEREFGRTRMKANEPRTLDLDILDYEGLIRDAPGLRLPHPRLHERAFVLVPLQEVAPAWRHPVSGKPAGELLAEISAAAQHDMRLLP